MINNRKVAAIIAEYNPFHNGHAYHIEETKRITGADYIIILMSGNFVQRGESAIIDKYLRAKSALSSGADAVFELPVTVSTGSAETFADGSVAVLASENVVKEATKESSAQAPAKKAGAKELPNTGTKQSNASLGLALLAAVTGGLLISKKRKEEE